MPYSMNNMLFSRVRKMESIPFLSYSHFFRNEYYFNSISHKRQYLSKLEVLSTKMVLLSRSFLLCLLFTMNLTSLVLQNPDEPLPKKKKKNILYIFPTFWTKTCKIENIPHCFYCFNHVTTDAAENVKHMTRKMTLPPYEEQNICHGILWKTRCWRVLQYLVITIAMNSIITQKESLNAEFV